MAKIAIIADDLTGASDSGVQLAAQGYETLVLFEPVEISSKMAGEVLVIDTDSRSIPSADAYNRVAGAAKTLKSIGIEVLFKKVDSTLRGNIGVEIDAILDTISYDFAIVAPAFPALGRTTTQGIHYLHAVPINQTEISRDPKTPVLESDVTKLLAHQSKRGIGLIDRSVLQDEVAIIRRLAKFKEQDISIVVFDAETEEDLSKTVNTVAKSGLKALWVGSAGLAEPMAELLGRQGISLNCLEKPKAASVMLVSGSLSAITKKQVEACLSYDNVTGVGIDPLQLVDCLAGEREKENCIEHIITALDNKRDIVLYVKPVSEQLNISIDRSQLALKISEALGEITTKVLWQRDVESLILTGGDTARSVCQHLGVQAIRLLGEIERGIPLSRMVGYKNLLTVTKAGAFGTENSLIKAIKVLKGEEGWLNQP